MKLFALLIAALILQGCAITGNLTREVQREEHFNYSVRFCGGNDCLNELLRMINSSGNETRCALYSADESVLQLLQQKKLQSVVDGNAKTYGTTAIRRNGTALMHNKFCVFDGSIVWTGSFNPTKRNARDDVIIINSTLLAKNYIEEFEELKGNGSRKTTTTAIILNTTLVESYFCPEDDCIEALQGRLAAANTSIYFATYSFTHPKIANELIIKNSEGVAVRGIIEKGSSYSQFQTLKSYGLAVAEDDSKYLLHHKFFIIDGSTVITGSFNPTRNGDERNDENMLVVHNREVAMEYLDYFGELTQKA